MITIRSPLRVEPDSTCGGWKVVLYVGDPFNYETPFRLMLLEIAGALGRVPDRDLRLPAYEKHEDFVTGTLAFGEERLGIYFEYSLGYLAISSNTRSTLVGLLDRLGGVCRVVSG